jgi:hypothetical protein
LAGARNKALIDERRGDQDERDADEGADPVEFAEAKLICNREGEIGVRHHFLTANPFPKKPPVRLVLQDCFLSRFAA